MTGTLRNKKKIGEKLWKPMTPCSMSQGMVNVDYELRTHVCVFVCASLVWGEEFDCCKLSLSMLLIVTVLFSLHYYSSLEIYNLWFCCYYFLLYCRTIMIFVVIFVIIIILQMYLIIHLAIFIYEIIIVFLFQ